MAYVQHIGCIQLGLELCFSKIRQLDDMEPWIRIVGGGFFLVKVDEAKGPGRYVLLRGC